MRTNQLLKLDRGMPSKTKQKMVKCKTPARFLQGGVALISVLLVVAILMAVASRLLANHNLVINQHQNTFEHDQALHYALGAETLAKQALYEDATISGKDIDHLDELWAKDVLPFELDEGGYLEAQLRDLNGCFNLNALSTVDQSNQEPLKQAKRLLRLLNMEPQLAEAWTDWVDADLTPTGLGGAEDNQYLVSDPSYRTPNQMVTSLSELNLLANIEQSELKRLLPHVCALPDQANTINVNTASAPVLAAFMDDQKASLSISEPIVGSQRSFDSIANFTSEHADFVDASSYLSVQSTYFMLHVHAQVGAATVTLQSLLKREQDTVTVLARDFGKLFTSNVQIQTSQN